MELATIARPYAEALFRVAKSGNLAQWSESVSEMAQVAAHPDVLDVEQNASEACRAQCGRDLVDHRHAHETLHDFARTERAIDVNVGFA